MKSKILPPTYFLGFLFAIILLHFVLPISQIMFFPYNLGGIALIIFGIVLNLWTDNLFKKDKTTVKPDEKPATLITRGPFRLTRQPMYVGMTAILLGTAVICGSLITLPLPIIFAILMWVLFVPMESKIMTETFGEKYLAYKQKVKF